MTIETTNTAANAWALDVQGFKAAEVMPELLLLNTSTVTRHNLGDDQAVRIPVIRDMDAAFVAEGAQITEEEPTLDEETVFTHKAANLTVLSRELARQQAGQPLADAMKRAVVHRQNQAYLHGTTPAGLLGQATDGGALGANLDAISDAVWDVAAASGSADWMVLAPSAAATLSKLKVGDGSNQALIANLSDLYNLNVYVSNDMAADTILLGSKNAVFSAVGEVELAISDEWKFDHDARAYRVTLRAGWVVANAAGLVKVSTAAA